MSQWRAVEATLRERRTTPNGHTEDIAETDAEAEDVAHKPLEKAPSFDRQGSTLSNEVGLSPSTSVIIVGKTYELEKRLMNAKSEVCFVILTHTDKTI